MRMRSRLLGSIVKGAGLGVHLLVGQRVISSPKYGRTQHRCLGGGGSFQNMICSYTFLNNPFIISLCPFPSPWIFPHPHELWSQPSHRCLSHSWRRVRCWRGSRKGSKLPSTRALSGFNRLVRLAYLMYKQPTKCLMYKQPTNLKQNYLQPGLCQVSTVWSG